ncbi:MAG: hypothetical protein R2688_01365 [Fimbriimonadaceae bacterium]
MNQRKLNYGLGTTWNFETEGRPTDSSDVSKLVELSLDHGTSFNGFGLQSTLRAQRIRPDGNTAWSDRLSLNSQLLAPVQNPRRELERLRDGRWHRSHRHQKPIRLCAGTPWHLRPTIRRLHHRWIVQCYYPIRHPRIAFDGVPVTHSMNLRADYRKGPYTFSYLAKYDLRNSIWYDKEWEIALAAGTFEPFIVSREFPSDFRMGIRFRINSFVDRLQQRNPKEKALKVVRAPSPREESPRKVNSTVTSRLFQITQRFVAMRARTQQYDPNVIHLDR